MKKLLIDIWTFIRHNPGICSAIPLCTVFLVWIYGCQPQVVSILYPDIMVTRIELAGEVETFLNQAESKFEDLDRQDLVRGTIFNSLAELIETGTLNPAALFLTLGNILGVGAVIDNVKKRTLIATLKNHVNKSGP